MSKTGGGSWVCLALLGLVACSSPAAPPAEGSAQVNFSVCTLPQQTISGPGGTPSGSKVGPNQTVLDGRGGYVVKCSVAGSGNSYSVSATIVGPDMTLTVDSKSVSPSGSGMATMSFATTQTLNNTYSSATDGCTLTTKSTTTTGLTVRPGSIWATYDCPTTTDPNNLNNGCHTTGYIVFTGCDH